MVLKSYESETDKKFKFIRKATSNEIQSHALVRKIDLNKA